MTNLHDFQSELYLGFLSEQSLTEANHQISYIGGNPKWLADISNGKMLECSSQECSVNNQSEKMTFLGQIFCPLNGKHCYNRILYIFYCQKCRRCFKCIKQQTDENWQPKVFNSNLKYKVMNEKSYEIQSDSIQRKQLMKIMNRARIQVEEQIIQELQNQDDDDQGQEQVINVEKLTGEDYKIKLNESEKNRKQKNYSEKQIEEINKKYQQIKKNQKDNQQKETQKQLESKKIDQNFEIYKKVIKTLANPIMLYSNIALPYNKLALNPRHNCKYCGLKLELEVQITEKVLGTNKSLAMLDWGSLFIYTCTGSCKQSEEQCLVVQYELDAISEEQINKLKKTKKQRRNNKKKSVSKSKEKERKLSKGKNIQPEKVEMREEKEEEEGDWD